MTTRDRLFERILITVVAIILVTGSFPLSAFAEETERDITTPQPAQTETLQQEKDGKEESQKETASETQAPQEEPASDPRSEESTKENSTPTSQEEPGSASRTEESSKEDSALSDADPGEEGTKGTEKAGTEKEPRVRMQKKEDHYVTFRFYVDPSAAPVRTQIVGDGEKLFRPETPSGKTGEKFLGWFKKGASEPFDGFGVIQASKDETVDLYARFEKQGTVFVTYHDQDGSIILREEAPMDSTVTIHPRYPVVSLDSLNEEHVGWTLTRGSRNEVTGEYKLGKKDIDLYPIVMEGYRVTFDTQGGTFIRDQFLKHDSATSVVKAARPETDPEKSGFAFTGWYTDKKGTVPFDFDQAITGATTIYAGWEPGTDTPYTVIYWMEFPTADNSGWEYRKVMEQRKTGVTGEMTQFDEDLVFIETGYKEKGFALNAVRTQPKEITPDGNGEMNVYYDRKVFTITFKGMKDREGNAYELSKTGKFGTDISDLWEELDRRSGLDALFAAGHFKWSSVHLDTPYNVMTISFEDQVYTYGPRQSGRLWYRLFLETLEGVAPDGKETYKNTSARVLYGTTVDDRTYYLSETSSFSAGWKACVIFNDPIMGFTLKLGQSDGNVGTATINGVSYPGAWYNPISTALFGVDNKRLRDGGVIYRYTPGGAPADPASGNYYDTDGYMDLYCIRNQYKLLFETNGGEPVASEDVYYEKSLQGYKPSEYVEGVTTKEAADGHMLIFDGWYSDPAFTQPFDFSGTMPYSDKILYAKWVPETYDVTFDPNGGSPVLTQKGIEYGKPVARPEDPVYEGKTFLGWVLDKTPYDFSQAVYRAFTLIGQWKDNKGYTITYDLNGGRGKAPKDTNRYGADVTTKVLSPGNVKPPAGKCFNRWVDTEGNYYYPGDRVTITDHDVVLMACWDDLNPPASLIYDFNFKRFGISTTASKKMMTRSHLLNNSLITLEDAISLLGKSINGYRFVGWHLLPDCSDPALSYLRVKALREGGNVVYAEWEPIQENDDPIPPDDPDKDTDDREKPLPTEKHEQISTPETGGKALLTKKHDQVESPETGETTSVELMMILFMVALILLVTVAAGYRAGKRF